MKLKDILARMTKFYLSRIANSIIKNVKVKDDDHLREVILKNSILLVDEQRTKDKLNFHAELKRDIALLDEIILDLVLQQNDYIVEEQALFDSVKTYEEAIVNESKDDKVLANCNDDYLDIYTTVLKAAWDTDGEISSHEAFILQVLQSRLGLTNYEHRILEARLKKFPHPGNKLHSSSDVDESLKDLQNRGFLFRIKDNDVYYVIPEEIAVPLRKLTGVELRADAYSLLLQSLSVNQLQRILAVNKLFVSGKKEELCGRIINARIKPSKALTVFKDDEIYHICKSLDGVKVSCPKDEKVENIIAYYNNLVTKKPADPTDERALYFEYLHELASRNYEQLRGNKVISKDLEVEHYFEGGTQYLFEKKLGHKPVKMNGSNHADGKLTINTNEIILWDNKSCEKDYDFPEAHFEQFKGYIKGEDKKVTLFLVIAPGFVDGVEAKAHKLKAFTGGDTDVGLITANELKYLVEKWTRLRILEKFDLRVLDHTGRLTKEVLDQRLKWFVS